MTRRFEGSVLDKVTPEDVASLLRELASSGGPEGFGGIAIFVGCVKGLVDGKRVKRLVYEAYEPFASRKLREISESFSSDPNVNSVVIAHASGELSPGDIALFIAVSARDRKRALEALSSALERVKAEAPIFKLEVREDGEFYVVGNSVRVKRT
ncbi:MAG: molybdenum cofactor biosynthesis protein MoaE [Fervidicoccaceae archaeon]